MPTEITLLKQRIGLAVIALALLLTLIAFFYGTISAFLSTSLSQFQSWLHQHLFLGAVVFLLLQSVAACCLLPMTVFGLLAGSIFSLPVGVCLTLAGNQGGILLAYLIGSSFLRAWVQHLSQTDPRVRILCY